MPSVGKDEKEVMDNPISIQGGTVFSPPTGEVVVTLAALFINELFTHNLYTTQIGFVIWSLLGALSMLYQERKVRTVP